MVPVFSHIFSSLEPCSLFLLRPHHFLGVFKGIIKGLGRHVP